MQFGNADCTIQQTNCRDPFQFSPTACAVPLSQKGEYANTVADGYRFDVGDVACDFELHQRPLYLCPGFLQERANGMAQRQRQAVDALCYYRATWHLVGAYHQRRSRCRLEPAFAVTISINITMNACQTRKVIHFVDCAADSLENGFTPVSDILPLV